MFRNRKYLSFSAAGPQSGHVANMFGIGLGSGLLRIPLPVEPRKRYVYNFHAPTGMKQMN